jgi:cell division control protein 7
VKYMQSVNLRDWCETNSRRPEFLKNIPDSLFDLIDKCLTVNPRRRLSAEEALAHCFFQPCHESLRKRRLLKKSSQPGSSQVLR